MEVDIKAIQENFRGMSREYLLEELALRADDYTPMARQILEGEARSRGITAAEIQAARRPSGADAGSDIDFPALLVSSMDKDEIRELQAALRDRNLPSVVREMDLARFGGCAGPAVGRWGLFVPGPYAVEAGRLLDRLLPTQSENPGDGHACGTGHEEPAPDENAWPEDGDWWRTGGDEGKNPP